MVCELLEITKEDLGDMKENQTIEQKLKRAYLDALILFVIYFIIHLFLVIFVAFKYDEYNEKLFVLIIATICISWFFNIREIIKMLKDKKLLKQGDIIEIVGIVEKMKVAFRPTGVDIHYPIGVMSFRVKNVKTGEAVILSYSSELKKGETYKFYYLKNSKVYVSEPMEQGNGEARNQIEQNTQSTVSNEDQTEQQKDKHE